MAPFVCRAHIQKSLSGKNMRIEVRWSEGNMIACRFGLEVTPMLTVEVIE
jgi:hypothetical protein